MSIDLRVFAYILKLSLMFFMAVEVKNVSYLQKVGGSIKGLFVGVLILIFSAGFLFVNEGKVDLSKFAKKAVPVFQAEELVQLDGELVALVGPVNAQGVLTDGIVEFADVISLNSEVETFAWVERSKTSTQKNVGGSETQTTEYTYDLEWVSYVPDSSNFKDPVGHSNNTQEFSNTFVTSENIITLGLSITNNGLKIPRADKDVTSQVKVLNESFKIDGGYLFNGLGTLVAPEIGDVRVKYFALGDLENGTVFGKWNQSQNRLDPFFPKENIKIFALYKGGKEEAVQAMLNEYKAVQWGIRLFMVFLIFVSFNLILKPLATVLDVMPALGNLGSSAISLVSLLLTVVLSLLIIVIAKIFYSWILLLLAFAGVGIVVYRKYGNRK